MTVGKGDIRHPVVPLGKIGTAVKVCCPIFLPECADSVVSDLPEDETGARHLEEGILLLGRHRPAGGGSPEISDIPSITGIGIPAGGKIQIVLVAASLRTDARFRRRGPFPLASDVTAKAPII
ncbi:hypothetical protein SDC9_177258 [bioreactor metagenome]|uniref:Uncharacterized protein n=1 Tax=bioreactor metagenome TaxID=1076179 RepID=A0A645GST1_9ZZZZ